MECPRCKFNNLPGTPQCGKCGLDLTVSEKSEHSSDQFPNQISRFYPPRKSNRTQRRIQAWRSNFKATARFFSRSVDLPPIRIGISAAIMSLIIPCLGLFYIRERKYAQIFLGAMILAVIMSILFIKSAVANLMITVALASYTSAIYYSVWLPYTRKNEKLPNLKIRLGSALIIMAVISFLGTIIWQTVFFDYQIVQLTQYIYPPFFYTNDRLLTRWLDSDEKIQLERGDWVYFRHDAIFVIGPIVALPNEEIHYDTTGLCVNGQSIELSTYNIPAIHVKKPVDLTVGNDRYLVWLMHGNHYPQHEHLGISLLTAGKEPGLYPADIYAIRAVDVERIVLATTSPAHRRRLW